MPADVNHRPTDLTVFVIANVVNVFMVGIFLSRPLGLKTVERALGLTQIALIVLFIGVTVIGLPLSGLAAVFGEEYGWRGFLQDELVRLGQLPGVFLVGLVWGVWHWPAVLRGVHTYPPTGAGLLLGLIFFVLWGFVQSYAVLKRGTLLAAHRYSCLGRFPRTWLFPLEQQPTRRVEQTAATLAVDIALRAFQRVHGGITLSRSIPQTV